MNPRIVQSVCVTARHHALFGQVVQIVQRKRHRGEAYVVVKVKDGSRQLIAARNTELADALPSTPDLRFTPGSLRALVDVIKDCRARMNHENADAVASFAKASNMETASPGDAAAGREALDRTAEPSAAPAQSCKSWSRSP